MSKTLRCKNKKDACQNYVQEAALNVPRSQFWSPNLKKLLKVAKVVFRVDETLLFPTPADLDNLPKMGPEPALRPSLPHAPGVRMTAVTKLTPSNNI